jgi:hypothetical protein
MYQTGAACSGLGGEFNAKLAKDAKLAKRLQDRSAD